MIKIMPWLVFRQCLIQTTLCSFNQGRPKVSISFSWTVFKYLVSKWRPPLLRQWILTSEPNFHLSDLSEFPTLLHFSACHGLDRLTSVLLECPGSREASNLRNGSDLNPIELAQINGHANLAKQLHAFQVPNYCLIASLSSMYEIITSS